MNENRSSGCIVDRFAAGEWFKNRAENNRWVRRIDMRFVIATLSYSLARWVSIDKRACIDWLSPSSG
jgi:hypothetical protein